MNHGYPQGFHPNPYPQQHVAGYAPQQLVGYVPEYTAGGYEIVGAPMAMRPQSPAQAVPMGTLPNGGQPVLQQQEPRNIRQYPLGFVSLAIAASGNAQATSRPQVLFRGYRLIIPAAIAVNFVVTDLRVGKNSQLVQATELPAAIFTENAFDVALTLDTAQVSQDITIAVRNTDGAAAHDFRAVLIGAAVE